LLTACATHPSSPNRSAGPIASPLYRPASPSPDGSALSDTQRRFAEMRAELEVQKQLDSSEELFDCLRPGQCPTSWEERAKRRASSKWACPAEQILASPRPTKGLQAPGSQMVFKADGRAEYHASPGVKGDAAFELSGCDHRGIIACIPAHRSVSTPHQSYDNVDDHVCLWAKDPAAVGQ
jgi:hypothetical protein